jgi:hypothetical protein
VELIGSTFHSDDRRYWIGDIEVRCTADEREACERLVNAYHPVLDAFQIVPSNGSDGPPSDDGDRIFIRVQCAVDDAVRVWHLLRDRLSREQGVMIEQEDLDQPLTV